MRLAHRILATPAKHGTRLFDEQACELESVWELAITDLKRAVVVLADNVEEFMLQSDNRNKSFCDFPSLAPPFQTSFIEWRDTKGSSYLDCNVVNGVLIQAIDRCNSGQTEIYESIATSFGESEAIAALSGEGRWILVCRLFQAFSSDGGVPFMVPRIVSVVLDRSGKYIAGGCGKYRAKYEEGNNAYFELVAMVTFAFMNCRNVVRSDVSDSENPPNRVLRRNKIPRLSFRTISISQIAATLKSEGRVSDVGVAKAMHICRGHFATYTDEKPLFGKVSGTVWRPMHVRGREENGQVVKQYNVKPAGGKE